MPIYEYKCTICEERFEVEQSIKANTLKTIKGDDHRHTVKKVFHAPGISFKGDGFYKNDARGKKKSGSASSDSSSSSSETTKTDSKTDSSSSDTSSAKSTDSKASDSKASDSKKSSAKKSDKKSSSSA